jgi:hypothetical protein
MNKLDAQRQKEIQQAEELLFAGPQALGWQALPRNAILVV